MNDQHCPRNWMRRTLYGISLICALLWFGGAPAATAAPLAQDSSLTEELATRVNDLRTRYGLRPLQQNPKLVLAAQWQAAYMETIDFVTHLDGSNGRVEERARQAGYEAHVTELVYAGSGGAEKPFEWWQQEELQLSLLLSGRYTEMGIGAVEGDRGQTYWTLVLGAGDNATPVATSQTTTPSPASATSTQPPATATRTPTAEPPPPTTPPPTATPEPTSRPTVIAAVVESAPTASPTKPPPPTAVPTTAIALPTTPRADLIVGQFATAVGVVMVVFTLYAWFTRLQE